MCIFIIVNNFLQFYGYFFNFLKLWLFFKNTQSKIAIYLIDPSKYDQTNEKLLKLN